MVIGSVTLLATVCHLLTQWPSVGVPVCEEHRVLSSRDNEALTMRVCETKAQMIIAQWKMTGRYADESFTISAYRCAPGDEDPRGRT